MIKQFARLPRPTPPKELDELTAREQEVFRLIADGLSNTEIAQELYISDTTVKTHITHILQKLNLRDRVQAVVLAYQTGALRGGRTVAPRRPVQRLSGVGETPTSTALRMTAVRRIRAMEGAT